MKKMTIWIIATIMGFSFLGLLFLQIKYIDEMVEMKREQFDESVNRSLYQASRNLELNETLRYLEKDVKETRRKSAMNDSAEVGNWRSVNHTSFEEKTIRTKLGNMPKGIILRTDKHSASETSKAMQQIFRNRYIYQKSLLDEVIMSILYSASEKPLQERVNFKLLDQDLKAELVNNGINIPYHFTVTTQDGREVYRCPDYTEDGEEYTYSQVLFRNDPQSKMGVVKIHFPDMNSYIFSSVRFMIPSIIFTLILLVTFIFTIVVIFRQKRYTEMKNDFINNMTHEFKTPISSISLAAQMLSDPTIGKSEENVKRFTAVISDETKRLRFQVEKVLQMSLFDKKGGVFNPRETHLNRILEDVANTFRLKVESSGGSIATFFNARHDLVYGDEMHLTNVIFNLLDNAVKYKHPDRNLRIHLTTQDRSHGRIAVIVEDNGIGIKRDDLKKIFEQFYRAHTGNRHDVKGFGLGLAYVKKVVDFHHGTIHAESAGTNGTRFIVTLPTINDNGK